MAKLYPMGTSYIVEYFDMQAKPKKRRWRPWNKELYITLDEAITYVNILPALSGERMRFRVVEVRQDVVWWPSKGK